MDHKKITNLSYRVKTIVNSTVFIILSLRHMFKCFYIDPNKFKIIANNVTKRPT